MMPVNRVIYTDYSISLKTVIRLGSVSAMLDINTPKQQFYRGLIASIPILISLIPVALLLGAQALQTGLTVYDITLMAGINFAGGSEFVALSIWSFPPQILLIILTTFLVNSRHILMGAALTPYLKGLPNYKVFSTLFFMCDETWAMGFMEIKRSTHKLFNYPFYLGACTGIYLTWLLSTAIGALLGPLFGDIRQYGFDMAFIAVFLVLLKGMWRGIKPAIPWLISFIASLITYLIVTGPWYVMVGAITGLLSAYLMVEYD